MGVEKILEYGAIFITVADSSVSLENDSSPINVLSNIGQIITAVFSKSQGGTIAFAPGAAVVTTGKIITDAQNGQTISAGDILSVTGNAIAIIGTVGALISTAPVTVPAAALGLALGALGWASNTKYGSSKLEKLRNYILDVGYAGSSSLGDNYDSLDISIGNLQNSINKAQTTPIIFTGTNGGVTTIGTNGGVTITGTDWADTITGTSGNDTINAGTGDDTVDGGAGNDTINAGFGIDTVDGGAGDDTIDAGFGRKIVDGGAGNDLLIADYSAYISPRYAGSIGVNGRPFLGIYSWSYATIGNRPYSNGNGGFNGRYTVDSSFSDGLKETYTSEVNFSNIERFQITGTSRNDYITTGDGNDTINGGAGDDVITARAGNDTINGGAGDDTISGAGYNTIYSFNQKNPNLGKGEIDTLTGGAGSDKFILGGINWIAYDDGLTNNAGTSDYAKITDFNPDDVIQLSGSSSYYLLTVSGANTNLYINKPGTEPDELIAILENRTGLSLTGNYFSYSGSGSIPQLTITNDDIANTNNPPTLANPIADQNAKQGTAFNFQVPTNSFADIDAGDVLTYSATLENGNALPSWLTFNPTTRTFSGTPTNDNVGNLNVKAIATDRAGATVSDIFTLTVQNVNDAPVLSNAIADQTTNEDQAFNFQIPANTFTDIDAGDVIAYSATLENGNALPSWLTFNPTTRIFSGTPTNDNVENLNVKAIATDKAGATVSDIFAITVENVNDAPILSNAIADQNTKQGTAFNFQIPTNTFTDIDAGDVLTYSATLENGNALPSWLTFNPTTRTFSGTPTNDNVGNLNVKVAATDKIGASVNDTFTIKVQNVNTAPILKNQLVDQTVKVNSTFTFTLPKDTFSDPDAVNPYKNLVIFGDSLSDTGNAYKASGNTFPPSPNYQGRLSNGLIWVDYFAPDLQFTNPSIQNYAFLGANTGVSNTFGQITVPGLLTQIQQFKTVNANSIGKDGLYVIWTGTNDFLNLATDPTQAVTNAVTNISSAIATLAELGAKEIVVGNLTDLGSLPGSIASNNVANARAISIGFNAALTQALTNLEPALNVDLSLVDIFGLSTAVQANPANYKFTNITQPLITATNPVNPDQYAFWDDVHPTTRLHQLVTDTFENTLLNDAVIPDLIKYSATLADGSNLPDWLNFNSTTRTFSGTPNTGNVGKLDVKVIATDKAGATVNDIFTLAVNQSTTVGTPGDDKLIATPGSQFDGQNNIVFTGAGKDEVDLSTVSAFPNSGNNIVDLGSGDDTIFVNKSDRAFGSDGNDTFDARDGQGGNRISGGVGDDTFYLGSNDRALGGDGKDIFRVSLGGGNLISGGAGADQFWIVNAELPKAANTVLDFQLGTDVIGIQGAVSLGITTSTLKLNQVGGDTAIVFNNQTLATLTGIQASSLSLTDPKQFVFA